MSISETPIIPSIADEKCVEAFHNTCYQELEDGPWLDREKAAQLIARHVAASTAYLRTLVMDAIAELEKPETMRNAGKIALAKDELNRLEGKL